ncbi:hypothetical protein DWX14_01395 [Clostridiaceae bacterium AF18-31LB]|nr:hypothetical protein DWX14_01395 [Clostridiaceae bacterium AF18-31LB]
MKKRITSMFLVLLMVLSLMPATVQASPASSGSGTKDDPYLIATAQDLVDFRDEVNASANKSTSPLCVKLTANINLGGQEWTPIGQYKGYSENVAYGGTFDGDGHTITGLSINATTAYQGLFGYVKGGTIKNLTVDGTVSTSTSSSAYAAGIVGYGSPVTMENCVNRADVTATANGSVAGVVACTGSTGSSINGCSNQGEICGNGGYIGGIVGSGSSSGTTIKNCLNSGSITSTKESGSYPYCIGGIAGNISGATSVIERSGNTGDISSTIKRTGGIAGGVSGTVKSCFNTGKINGIYSTGGIAGSIASSSTKITDCYNWGDVSCNAPTATLSDTNAKGVGGIVGDPSSTSYKDSVLENCYNAGSIVNNDSVTEEIVLGGVVGSSSAKNYKGVETKNLITAQNCYYLSADGLNGDGANAGASGITAKTADELKASDMAGLLGGSYISRTDQYPILGWQDPDAKYTVKFVINPATAQLTVKQNDTVVSPESDGSYALKNGTYTYEVSAPECQTETSSFTVAYGGQTITVALKEALYDVAFTTVPGDAELTVAGRTPEADGRTYRLPKSGSPYSYTLKAFGYEEKTGSFTVTGNVKTDAQKITMTELPKQTVTFGAVTAADQKAITPVIAVTCPEWPGEKIQAAADGSFSLPAGTYNYVISCSGYKSVKDSFTVENQAVQIPAYTLEVQTAWDGETYTVPLKDESGAYQIGSPDELMWFGKNAEMSDAAVLTADITINEDVNAEASGLYKWKPVGTSASRYAGTFDGDGHTISGLYVAVTGSVSTAKYAGLFGYAGKGSKISNLTISDSVVSASGDYAGAVAGEAYDMENCHVTDSVTVSAQKYAGGVAGYVDGSIQTSSNEGKVTASSNYAGGVAGCVYGSGSTAMTQCYNSGAVTGANQVGGLAGSLYMGGTISDSYNTGTVTAVSGVAGGIVGLYRYGSIKNVYTSTLPTATNAGSVAGKLDFKNGAKSLENVYVPQSDLNTVGNLDKCTIQNGDAQQKTTEELKALASTLGDKFAEDSENSNQGYPILKWQAGSDEPDPDQPTVDPAGWDGRTATQPKQEEGIYQISSAAELKWFADAAKKTTDIKGTLTADVDLNHRAWTPIGGTTADSAFAGTLDGASNTVKNLYCKTNGAAGLFAWNKGTICDLKVTGTILGGDDTAAIAARNLGTIEKCTADAAVTGGNDTAGIAGENYGTITDCTNQGTVRGGQYVAGIAGENKATKTSKAKISGCINTGMIRATGHMVGGIAGNNETYSDDFSSALVETSANSGHIICTAAIMRSYTGGCVGRNNGKVDKLYNSGSVESMGGCVGGTLGLNVTKAEKSNLYNIGDVTGGDFEDEGYPTDNQVSSESELAQAKNQMNEVLTRLGSKEAISGTLSINGTAEVEETVTAQYTGDQTDLIYIWYYSYDENDDVVLSITEKPEYKIPQNMAGRKLRVKALCADASGVLKAETESAVKGLTGSLKIEGAPVVGRTLTAVFKSSDSTPVKYQWYQGKTLIEGATGETYTVKAADEGKVLTVRVTSDQVAGMLEASTKTVTTAADADMWGSDQCTEPANVGGVYMIGTEMELHWFASEVNGGNTAISGKLLKDIELTTDNWYPIGRSGHAYAGTFDGYGKHITNLNITSMKDETGFFGLIAGGGKVKSLNLSGTVTVTGDVSQTGGIAGAMEDVEKASSITDCSFSGSVNGNIQVGGIVGCVGLHNNVERCSNTAAVTGKQLIGGIAGANSYGNIRYCRNTGTVGNDTAEQVGGIVGAHQNYAELIASYNTGEVKGADYIGGIAGNVYVASMPLGCYNVGSVSSGIRCGGAVGSFGGDDYITIKNGSFYKGPLSGAYKANGAKMKYAEEMKKDSFVSALNAEAYVTCYTKDTHNNKNNGYPILTWEVDGFQVTFDANGGDCDIRDVNVAVNGSLNELPTPYRWNYKFDGWFTEKDGGKAITTETKFNADTVLYAHWTLIRPSTGEQSKKTVYFSLSLNGQYVTGNDEDSTLLAMVPVDVEYFDLSAYDLQKYMITENGAPVEQPTVLHLMIQMLEKYHLSGSKVANNTDAMTVTGEFGHMYFKKFWGNGSNLTYFLNHQYPLMKPGMGATADYMTLEDGDVIDVAMYSNENFYKDANAGFPYFTLPDGTAAEQMEMTASEPKEVVLHRGWANMTTGERTDVTVAGAKVYYTTDPSLPKEQWTEMGMTRNDGSLICRFPDAGTRTQYLMVEGTDVSAPAICKVTVQPGAEQLPDKGYALSVSGGSASLPIGDDVPAVITVKSKNETTYNAYDLTVTYDPAVLTYQGINDANVSNLKVTDDGPGTLKITGYGEDRTVGIDNILLTFTGKAAGESNITVTAAKIDKSEHATADAPEAQILNASCKVTVENIHSVTLTGEIHGDSTVKDGTDYRINLNDQHYDYKITAQMNGQNVTAEKKTDASGDVYYSIGNVTGDLDVTATRTPKTYTVTTDGTGKEDLTAEAKATYLKDYTFTVNKVYGYTYLVTVTRDGTDCLVTMDADQKTYTILGKDVTGDLAITVTKKIDMDTRTKVNFMGLGSGNVSGGTTQLAMRNQEFTFTMTAADVYEYTLKLADGMVLTAASDGKTYTIPADKMTGAELNVTVERKAIITRKVSKYLDLSNGNAIWLVTASGAVDDGNILTYDTHSMYWSTNYQAYAYLLISDKSKSEVETEAAGKVQESAGTKQTLAYDYDVNGTKIVDINDVQLIYNMYNAMYENFDMATMEKFLNADVNNDRTVNVLDARQAVQEMIKRNK